MSAEPLPPELLAAIVNGHPAHEISLLDRGLHYGDGLFETLAVKEGRAQLWERHLARLEQGCQRLHFPPPDGAALHDEAHALCTGHERAVLKILWTRGSGGRGYRIDRGIDRGIDHGKAAAARQTRALLLYRAPDYGAAPRRAGIAVRCCATRLGANAALAGIKHLNRLEQVLARDEWSDAGIAEGLMRDTHGRVICATASNVFAVRDGALLTPVLDECGVHGVMRGLIMETAASWGMAVHQTALRMEDLFAAEEVFLSNSLFGVWPVRRIDEIALKPGALAQRLAETLAPFHLSPP